MLSSKFFVVLALLLAVVVYMIRNPSSTIKAVSTSPQIARKATSFPSGLPSGLPQILRKCTDERVPELSAPVRHIPYNEPEIRAIVFVLLERMRSHGADAEMIGNAHRASKVVDGNNAIQYSARISVNVSPQNISILLDTVIIVSATSSFVKSVELATTPDQSSSIATAFPTQESEQQHMYAAYVDPVTLFANSAPVRY